MRHALPLFKTREKLSKFDSPYKVHFQIKTSEKIRDQICLEKFDSLTEIIYDFQFDMLIKI